MALPGPRIILRGVFGGVEEGGNLFLALTILFKSRISFSMASWVMLLKIWSLYQINLPARFIHFTLSRLGVFFSFALFWASSIKSRIEPII